jgi:hypothetical protein
MAESDGREAGQPALQFMTTEHFVLQTARSATIQEANGRANLFLTSLSSATIALAFVAQVTGMGEPFLIFSLILLPGLYFIGLATFVRAVQLAIEDMVHARGMARIRHYYAELAPPMERYFVHSMHDDYLTLLPDLGLEPSPWQFFMTTSGMVSAIASAVAGVFAGLATRAVAGSMIALAVAVGIAVFGASILLLRRYHIRAGRAAE